MSYEHCYKHDEEATNGCLSCLRERVEERGKELDDVLDSFVERELGSMGDTGLVEHYQAIRKMLPKRVRVLSLLQMLKERGFFIDDPREEVCMTSELLRD